MFGLVLTSGTAGENKMYKRGSGGKVAKEVSVRIQRTAEGCDVLLDSGREGGGKITRIGLQNETRHSAR